MNNEKVDNHLAVVGDNPEENARAFIGIVDSFIGSQVKCGLAQDVSMGVVISAFESILAMALHWHRPAIDGYIAEMSKRMDAYCEIYKDRAPSNQVKH